MKWTQEELDLLTRYYGQIPACQIVEQYLTERTVVAIHKKALKIGLKGNRYEMLSISKKQHHCNEEFFAGSGEDVCYWAGFIAADGCVRRADNSLKIELCNKDNGHLHKLRDALQFSGHIQLSHRSSVLRLYGFVGLLDDLQNRFSVTPRKSMTIQPPRLTSETDIRAFVRGFFDGDGSISYVSANDTWRVSITCGSEDLIRWISSKINVFLPNIRCNIYPDRRHYQLIFGGSRQSLRFLEWLYQDSMQETRLNRKYSLFLKLAKRLDEIDKYQASVYRGVCWDKIRQKWTSYIETNGRKQYLGRFDTEYEAALAYNQKARELGLLERCYEVI